MSESAPDASDPQPDLSPSERVASFIEEVNAKSSELPPDAVRDGGILCALLCMADDLYKIRRLFEDCLGDERDPFGADGTPGRASRPEDQPE